MADLNRITHAQEAHSAANSLSEDVSSGNGEAARPRVATSSLYAAMKALALPNRAVLQSEGADLENVIKSYYAIASDKQVAQIKEIAQSFCGLPKYLKFEVILNFILSSEEFALDEIADPQNFAVPGVNFGEGRSAQSFCEEYKKQFGETHEERLTYYLETFKMLPSELLRRSNLAENDPQFVDIRWINQAFVDAYDRIMAYDLANVTVGLSFIKELKRLPSVIGRLTALENLYLVFNSLHTLPAELSKLTSLKVLSMHNNETLTHIPAVVYTLQSLEELDVCETSLSEVTKEILSLPKLVDLVINLTNVTQENADNLDKWFREEERTVHINYYQ
jgi:hypothetical protein